MTGGAGFIGSHVADRLLERGHESTYRVRAFRGATVLRGCKPDELAALAASGELRRLRGVGDVTARCVAESLAGEEPDYLRRLLATEHAPVADDAFALRSALRGDCHSHTDASDGDTDAGREANSAHAASPCRTSSACGSGLRPMKATNRSIGSRASP